VARTVIKGFDELLGNLALTDNQEAAARSRRDGLVGFFTEHLTMDESAYGIGSYARSTLIRPERDIDLLAPLSANEYWQRFKDDSKVFLYWVRGKLNEGYEKTRVSSRGLSVKLDFSIVEADVVPCFVRRGEGYLMPNGAGGWLATNPRFHMKLMSDSNVASGSRLKPLVKLAKAWNVAHSHHLGSFHVELMVERMWRGRAIPSWPAAMASTLSRLSVMTTQSSGDPWSGGSRIDGYLSTDARALAVRMLTEDAARAADAERYRLAGDEREACGRWVVVYRDMFPAFG